MEEEVEVAFEIGRTSPAFRSLFGTNNGIGSQGIILDGTPEQKTLWLPRLASGELVASFALTEPDSGSDAASLKTTAKREGEHYVLNGTKRYITNAPEAGIFTVMARTNSQEKGARGISAFIVERATRGLSLGKTDRKMGQRGAHTCDVVFEAPSFPCRCRWHSRTARHRGDFGPLRHLSLQRPALEQRRAVRDQSPANRPGLAHQAECALAPNPAASEGSGRSVP
jgi:hypothetical protein